MQENVFVVDNQTILHKPSERALDAKVAWMTQILSYVCQARLSILLSRIKIFFC